MEQKNFKGKENYETNTKHTDSTFFSCSYDDKVLTCNIWYRLTHMVNPYSHSTKSYRNRWVSVYCLTNGISYTWQLLKTLDNTVQSLALLYRESLSYFLWLYL